MFAWVIIKGVTLHDSARAWLEAAMHTFHDTSDTWLLRKKGVIFHEKKPPEAACWPDAGLLKRKGGFLGNVLTATSSRQRPRGNVLTATSSRQRPLGNVL